MILVMDSGSLARRPAWVWSSALWCCAALFYAGETVIGMHAEGMRHNWVLLFLADCLAWLPWALATPLVLRLGRRKHLRSSRTVWTAHAGMVIAIQSVSSAWRAVLLLFWNPYANAHGQEEFGSIWFASFYSSLFGSVLLYAVIVSAAHILEDREHLLRRETEAANLREQLSQARFEGLRRQIEPHFLFNSLNSIAGLVREKRTEDATETIALLSAFLRRVVDESARQTVPKWHSSRIISRFSASASRNACIGA